MSTTSSLAARLFLLVLLTTVSHTSLRAQERAPENRPPAPIVTATISADRVRFTAPSDITAVRLEVYTVDGQRLFDSGFKSGTLMDWMMLDEQGQRHPSGAYLCVVAVKSLSGRVSHKLGTLNISVEGTASLEPVKATQFSATQLQALGVTENSSALTVLREREAIATTTIAHTGTDGAITIGQGALSFRVGDFYGGKDKEQMRLTEEGNLGIGTDNPQAKLDVGGVIRARDGIEFNDGSLLNVSPKGKLSLTLPRGKREAVSVTGGDAVTATGGTGTTNQVAKWTDNAGNLGDSSIFDNGLGVGVGTTDLTDVLVDGSDKLKVVDGPMTFSFRNFATGQGYFAVGSSANGIKGFIGHTNTADGFTLGTFSKHKLTIRTDSVNRLTIDTVGNVGIGTSVPTQKLDVAGNVRVSGAGNGIIFPDGSKMTTAVSGGGTPSGTSIVSAINDPATTGTINDNRLSAELARRNSNNNFNGNQSVVGSLHVNNNVSAGETLTGSVVNAATQFDLGGQRILHTQNSSNNLFVGINSPSESNVNNRTGATFIGSPGSNLLGDYNTVVGSDAGTLKAVNGQPGTGNNITLIGAGANIDPQGIFPYPSSATAIGARAYVSQANSLVLGGINGINGATADTNVGIGTTAPDFRLHILDPSNKALRVQTNTSGGTVASFGGFGEFQVDAQGTVGGRLVVKENGFVGIGQSSPGSRLDVNGIISVRQLGAAGSTTLCRNSSEQISTCSSSIRYKTNIANFSSGLNLINHLRPVTFDWKENKAHDLGLVAEEVAEVEPLLVIQNSKGEVEGVKYDRLNVVLVNAIKEQQAQIKSQADAFALLQKENLEMKKRLAALEQSLRQQR